MDDGSRYQINKPEVISEFLDDEVVIINLDSGSYYSLRGAGAEVWNALEAGATLAEIHQELPRLYTGDVEKQTASIEALLAHLLKEKLLVEAEREQPSLAELLPRKESGPEAFEKCSLEAFEDMKELLVLDPIHDVDETGWPQARPKEET